MFRKNANINDPAIWSTTAKDREAFGAGWADEYSFSLNQNYQVRLVVETTIEMQPRVPDLHWVVAHAGAGAQFVTSDNPAVEAEHKDMRMT